MKALIALSGGVDSACAAIMMKNQGYECMGVTMKLHTKNESSCLTSKDIEDARGVCENLKIPYTVVDFSSDFDKYVIKNFISAYENGATPNPCIECNFRLKFDKLYEYGMENGCDFIVTGHYARIEYDEKYGRRVLKRGIDSKKDQSYVLWRISREKLERTIFPLGNIESKDEARAMASKAGLDVSTKKDSQDICFIPDGDYIGFLQKKCGFCDKDGEFLDDGGNIIGKHRGTYRFTIGQRKGLGMTFGKPMFVTEICADKNTVTLSEAGGEYFSSLVAENVNFISGKILEGV